MLLRDVALYPWVLNKIPDFFKIVSFVTSGLRMLKDTNRYLNNKIVMTSFVIYCIRAEELIFPLTRSLKRGFVL